MCLESKPDFLWFAEAQRYLFSAEVMRKSPEYSQSSLLIAPTLHLLAHGIELFLKANLVQAGVAESDVRGFSHNLWRLWEDDRNADARIKILDMAKEEWLAAKSDQRWNDDFSQFAEIPLEEYLKRLSELHSRDTDYALRYVRPQGTEGPKPHLLSATFYRMANQRIREMR